MSFDKSFICCDPHQTLTDDEQQTVIPDVQCNNEQKRQRSKLDVGGGSETRLPLGMALGQAGVGPIKDS